MHFQDFQMAFAARLRDPRANPRPAGVPPRRMRAYEELLYNNIESFVGACFPISKRCLGERARKRLVKDFFSTSRLHSPLFRDIPEAFLDWLADEALKRFPNKPWLAEFMHYEWLELAVLMPEDAEREGIDPDGDLLGKLLVLNPAARLGCYHYAVEHIAPRKRPKADGQVHCYLVYRDARDEVEFMRVNPLTARLFELLEAEPLSGGEALARLATEIGHADPDALRPGGLEILRSLRAQGVILGTRM